MATKTKKTRPTPDGKPKLADLAAELTAAAKAIRDDCNRVIGTAAKLAGPDTDGKHGHRLQLIGGRVKMFMRQGKRYLAILVAAQQQAATY